MGQDTLLPVVEAGARVCQRGELLPAGASAIRLFLATQLSPGPRLAIELRHRGRLLQRTTASTGAPDQAVVAPIRPRARDLAGVTVCYVVGAQIGVVASFGGYTPPGTGRALIDGVATDGSIAIEYLRPGAESWWSFASTVARRIGMGRGDWGGSRVAWLAVGYASMAAGMLLLIGMVALRGWTPGIYSAVQGRYLLPLFAALLGLAARGAGRLWGRAVGVAIVLLAIAYYYG